MGSSQQLDRTRGIRAELGARISHENHGRVSPPGGAQLLAIITRDPEEVGIVRVGRLNGLRVRPAELDRRHEVVFEMRQPHGPLYEQRRQVLESLGMRRQQAGNTKQQH